MCRRSGDQWWRCGCTARPPSKKIDKELEKGTPTTGYGMTETHGIITANTSLWYTTKPSSCARWFPLSTPNWSTKRATTCLRDPNLTGILCVKGSIVIKGYLNRPEATAESIKDGWLNTGDIARIDPDGFVYIVDRAKDMVIRGGENVYCSEVEAAIYRHDAIAEAAVFGVPDERLGEEVAACIVLAPRQSGVRRTTCARSSHVARQAQDSVQDLVPRRADSAKCERQVLEA